MTPSGNWFWQSVIAAVLLVPAWLAIGFFERNYKVSPDIFMVWYISGIVLSTILFGDRPTKELVPGWQIALGILLVGLTIGWIANINIYRAVAGAHADGSNPGLPIAISNTASIGVFMAAIVLYRWWPSHFGPVKADMLSFTGMVLTIIGVGLIALRR